MAFFDESILPFTSIMLVGCMVAVGAVTAFYYGKRKKKAQDSSEQKKEESKP